MPAPRKARTALKRAAPNQLAVASLAEMFPDWDSADLAALLQEHIYPEVVIDMIVNHKVAKWESTTREKKKKPEHIDAEPIPAPIKQRAPKKELPPQKRKPQVKRPEKGEKDRAEKMPAQEKLEKPVAKALDKPTKPAEKSLDRPEKPLDELLEKTPDKKTSTHNSNVPLANSWAAALAPEKPKPKPVQVAPSLKQHVQSEIAQPEPKAEGSEHHAEEHHAEENLAQEPVASKDESAQTSGLWVSAIAPVTAHAAAKDLEHQHHAEPQPQEAAAAASQAQNVAETQAPAPEALPVSQPSVVLPASSRQVNTAGVSFGSLSLEDDQEQEVSDLRYMYEQQQQQQQQQQQRQQQPQQVAAESNYPQNNYQQYNKQSAHQPAQPVQASQPSQQQYDYYSQFQQQYPQQAPAAPQYGAFPGVDYSLYNGLAGVNSPAASLANTQYQYAQANGVAAAPSQGQATGEASQLPAVNPSVLQQPPAPYGYPYYNYYYNPSFYGQNGSNLGQGSSGQSPQQQQQQQQPPADLTANARTSNGQQLQQQQSPPSQQQAVNPNMYYAPTSQFNSRYPGYNYPHNPQQYAQAPSQGAAHEGETAQPGQQPAAAPQNGIPQQPMMYGAYQQYPQYAYQDNQQYRSWY